MLRPSCKKAVSQLNCKSKVAPSVVPCPINPNQLLGDRKVVGGEGTKDIGRGAEVTNFTMFGFTTITC